MDGRTPIPILWFRSFNGESIGQWEGDTLVVDTKYFVSDHHWIDSGIPGSDALHIVERMRLINNGAIAGDRIHADRSRRAGKADWKMTKRWSASTIAISRKSSCLPDLNSAHAEHAFEG